MFVRHLGILSTLLLFSWSLWAQVAPPSQGPNPGNTPPVDNKYQLLAKDVFFQPGGGLRVRYENLRQATGEAFPDSEDESQASHRALFDIKLYKGEYLETFFRFINFADWGGATGDTSGGQHDAFNRTNGLLVNQAYGVWKVDQIVDYLRFGRAPLHIGLGYTYGQNDWFNVPYSFDLFEAGWDWETMSIGLIAAKIQEFSTTAGQTVSSDPEENHIILDVEIVSPFDALEFLTFTAVQINRDLGSPDGGLSVLNGLNVQRFALESKISARHFFGSAFLAFVTGTEKVAAANVVNNQDTLTVSQLAFDIKLGYSFPQFKNFRLWAGYHQDSGDSDPTDGTNNAYDSFYYEVYGQSGLMDLIRWGNLSLVHAGLSVDLMVDMTLGAEWWSMSRTETNGPIQFGDAGRFFRANVNSGDLVFGNEQDIGTEFNLWIDQKFQSGVNLRFTFANFFPGAIFSNATGPGGAQLASGNSADSEIFQFLAQVGYSF
jgi:hypothetical protein